MGNKINPVALRLGFEKNLNIKSKYKAVWYDSVNFVNYVAEDIKIRQIIDKNVASEIFSSVIILRVNKKINIKIVTHKPGVLIGKQGVEITKLKQKIEKSIQKEVNIQIEDLYRPELDPKIVASEIAKQMAENVDYKKLIRFALQKAMGAGALGILIRLSGRLGGSLIARTEKFRAGSLARNSLKSDLNHHVCQALCKHGTDGVQVTIRVKS